MNYIQYQNQIYRKKYFCIISKKMFYLKKISKIKTGKYYYVYLQRKRMNVDRALQLIPSANEKQIIEINKLNK